MSAGKSASNKHTKTECVSDAAGTDVQRKKLLDAFGSHFKICAIAAPMNGTSPLREALSNTFPALLFGTN